MAPGGRAPRILVVDDYPDCADSIAALLALYGYEVRTARSVAEALEAVLFQPDGVLVDILLPDGDGYELAARLRRLVDPGPWFVAVTGFPHLEYRSQLAEFHGHLLKPVEPDVFLALVAELTGWPPDR
jgi:two-component system CheB/CheR fusion protein